MGRMRVAMRKIDLQEYGDDSARYHLSVEERDVLHGSIPSVGITPVPGTDCEYILKPTSVVGALEVGNLSVLIRPKIPIPQLLSLACYAMEVYKPQDQRLFDFEEDEALPGTLALALAAAARRAFSRGLLHGYQRREEALHTVRGRIRFNEQIRRRFGVPLPVEVRYDEFTDDILENRLVKAAVMWLGTMRLRSSNARRGIAGLRACLMASHMQSSRRAMCQKSRSTVLMNITEAWSGYPALFCNTVRSRRDAGEFGRPAS